MPFHDRAVRPDQSWNPGFYNDTWTKEQLTNAVKEARKHDIAKYKKGTGDPWWTEMVNEMGGRHDGPDEALLRLPDRVPQRTMGGAPTLH